MTRLLVALAMAFFACHTPAVQVAVDGTPYVENCPIGLEDVACYNYVTGN